MHSDDGGPRVLLASMPWAALGEPSLGLAILKTCLLQAGVPARVRHFNVFLLRRLRASTYVGLANAYALNDFVFTGDLDSGVSDAQRRIARARLAELRDVGVLRLPGEDLDEQVSALIDARATIFTEWMAACASWTAAYQPTLVGLTCLFDQTIASVALAKQVRALLPDVTIVLGGYALEGPVGAELLRCFPWIDAVCAGEGEPAIVELARASAGQRSLEGIPNVLTRLEARRVRLPLQGSADGVARRAPLATRAPFVALDTVPVPDFDDYYADLAELRDLDRVEVEVDTLPVETSRGCWWGQRSHCVFCGIDDETLHYRARTPESAIEMLDELHSRYGVTSFRFSDYILPHHYFDSLLPALAARSVRYHLECEVKANLDEGKFHKLAEAGFREVQPGIESFSTSVLRKMDKGVRGIRNVQTLVLGKSHGVRIHWNFLFGFPFDERAEYEALTSLIPMLYHLDPPHGCQPVEVTRFAPLQAAPERFGIARAGPATLYDVIFSPGFLRRSGFDLGAYAYYFQRTFNPSRQLRKVYAQLVLQVDHWKALQAQREVILGCERIPDGVRIVDSRFGEPVVTELVGLDAMVVEETLGEAKTVAGIAARVRATEVDVAQSLGRLVAGRLVLREEERYLGLAIPHQVGPTRPAFTRKWVAAKPTGPLGDAVPA
ncbi:MAG: RiPP maturation radical SAM C-methyltransferase [Dermatophilaceae bacterium]